MIATTADGASIPFWRRVLELTRPRGQGAADRRHYALAALALLAIRRDIPAAYAALTEVAQHGDPDVRALAIIHWGRAYLEAERPLPAAGVEALTRVATEDAAFAPRFQARDILRAAGLPLPRDGAGEVYVLRLRYGGDADLSRTIEIPTEQTLEDLHLAIQDAFEWDNDHLYTFFMNGKAHDPLYEIAGPETADDSFPFTFGAPRLARTTAQMPLDPETGAPSSDLTALQESSHRGGALDQRDDAPPADPQPATGPCFPIPESQLQRIGADFFAAGAVDDEELGEEYFSTIEAILGELGLVSKHKFLYLFDYGDEHLFEVEVLGTAPASPDAAYPRVVAQAGGPLAQYPEWDEE